MLSRLTISIVIVMFVAMGAFAQPSTVGQINQYQDFGVAIENIVGLFHGHQGGYSQQWVSVYNKNDADLPCPTWGQQWQDGYLKATANANGESAVLDVIGLLSAGALQEQVVGACVEPKVQLQALGMESSQLIIKADAAGEGTANHFTYLFQEQTGVNAAGAMTETSEIETGSLAFYAGGPSATGTVINTIIVTTTQGQSSY